ncbi:MAG: STAS domain-containing protein [Firmicutes bacterium]|nr:STAS domain-containing protein [Bacillota bacterium]
MEIKEIGAHTAVINLPDTVDIENYPVLTQSLNTLYEKGFTVIQLDFTSTKYIRKSCLGKIIMYHKKLKKRGGKLTIINVKSPTVRHLFDMLELCKIINIEETDA